MGSSFGGMTSVELLDQVEADPTATLAEAQKRCRATALPDEEFARLQWVIGMSERGLGHLQLASEALELASYRALAAHNRGLAARIQMSLAFVVGRLGELDRAMRILDAAEPFLSENDQARMMTQRGAITYWQGDVVSAVTILERACEALRQQDDRLGEARAQVNVGGWLSHIGRYASAREHLERAVVIAGEIGQHILVANALHNLGFTAMRSGDLPTAMQEFESAEQGMIAAGAMSYLPPIHAEHALALADAALFDDAESLLAKALTMLEEQGNEIEIAYGLLSVAALRLAKGDLDGAQGAAQAAASWYRKQQRVGWMAVATHYALQAAARREDPEPSLADQLVQTGGALRQNGFGAEATLAELSAARLRAELGDDRAELVSPLLRRRALKGRAVDRILLAHIDAIAAQRGGDRAAARRAISRGLSVAMSNQAALGSIETRAHAAVHGNALTEIGARMAIADGRPRELLARIEATRLMAARTPSLRPPADPELARFLAELRGFEATMADPSVSDEKRRDAEVAHARVERDVRRRGRAARGVAADRINVHGEIGSSLGLLDNRQLLAHARVDGRLHAVSVIGGRARLHDLGPVDDVNERIEALTFSLHRLNRIQGSDESRLAAAEMLYAFADELAEIVLPPIVTESFDPVVIVPTAILHDVPWGLLPALAGRSVSVNPSVSAWGNAERTLRERRGTLHDGIEAGFVAGPGLDFADIEVKHLAGGYVDPVVLVGEEATVAACAGLLSRAELVHMACHGSFRRDNPMFSSLHVADGPLNIYDLEGLERLPVVVVLSSCSVANAKVVQGGSLLGLANAFTTLGAASVIAPLTPISDAAAVTVMDRLHREIIAGADPAAALAAATMTHDVADPTAAAFIALGA